MPKTLEWIGDETFAQCSQLIAVMIIPRDDDIEPIKAGDASFATCSRLANLWVDSTAKDDSFAGCALLLDCYGEDTTSCILDGLIDRFDSFPIHKMFYDHSSVRLQELGQRITDHPTRNGMTPFHIPCSTIDPSLEFSHALLQSLPNRILKLKDVNGRRPVHYLIKNWSDGAEDT